MSPHFELSVLRGVELAAGFTAPPSVRALLTRWAGKLVPDADGLEIKAGYDTVGFMEVLRCGHPVVLSDGRHVAARRMELLNDAQFHDPDEVGALTRFIPIGVTTGGDTVGCVHDSVFVFVLLSGSGTFELHKSNVTLDELVSSIEDAMNSELEDVPLDVLVIVREIDRRRPPASRRICSLSEFADAEAKLGRHLPADYRTLCTTAGAGHYAGIELFGPGEGDHALQDFIDSHVNRLPPAYLPVARAADNTIFYFCRNAERYGTGLFVEGDVPQDGLHIIAPDLANLLMDYAHAR